MALRFADSFDHYATGDILSKWTTINGAVSITGSGRFGNGMECVTNRNVTKTLDNQATWITGFAFYIATDPATTVAVMKWSDGGTLHVDLRMNAAHSFQFTRNGTNIGSAGSIGLSTGTWYYLETLVTISDTVGEIELRINGATDIHNTNLDTRNAANATANNILIGNGPGGTLRFDDLYICDATGGTNNTFLGDIRVEALLPNGNGNYSQFTGSDGNSTDNYLLVDESTPNGDTDYVADSTVGHIDTYTFTDPTPTSGSVKGVQINHYSRKTDAGTRSARSVARLSGTDADNGVDQPLSTSYQYFTDVRETKPGGGAWSLSDVANAEFGVKVAA